MGSRGQVPTVRGFSSFFIVRELKFLKSAAQTARNDVAKASQIPLMQKAPLVQSFLGKRWPFPSSRMGLPRRCELDKTLERLTQQAAKRLRSQFGVGPQTAATLIAVAGDNPERLHSEAALAALCGANPLPASSGKTVRHRLNRSGDRSANNALWTITLVRMRSDPRTRAYVSRRTAEGKSTKV